MLIPSATTDGTLTITSLSRRVNANSQQIVSTFNPHHKLIKKGEC